MSDLQFGTRYERAPGIHTFITLDETPVTAIAVPTWQEFQESLGTLQGVEGYVVSPELITSSQVPIPEISDQRDQIETRINSVLDFSADHPDAMFLLGSATFDSDDLMRNSLVVIRKGSIEGYIDKRAAMWSGEGKIFTAQPRTQAKLLILGHSAIVCSDIISAATYGRYPDDALGKRLIDPRAETLFVSACWAVPQGSNVYAKPLDDSRFKVPLEKRIGQLFEYYPELKEVIMVDRQGPVKTVAPYTAHFTKKQRV
jgi:hypothetical protein